MSGPSTETHIDTADQLYQMRDRMSPLHLSEALLRLAKTDVFLPKEQLPAINTSLIEKMEQKVLDHLFEEIFANLIKAATLYAGKNSPEGAFSMAVVVRDLYPSQILATVHTRLVALASQISIALEDLESNEQLAVEITGLHYKGLRDTYFSDKQRTFRGILKQLSEQAPLE